MNPHTLTFPKALVTLLAGALDILWALGGIVLGGLVHGLTARD